MMSIMLHYIYLAHYTLQFLHLVYYSRQPEHALFKDQVLHTTYGKM